MSKSDDLLKALILNLNNWTCGYCNSGSNQPAAIFREIKKQGYLFEEVEPTRWARNMHCSVCKTKRSHYKLIKGIPHFKEKERISITPETRRRIIKLFKFKDALSGATITSTPEIDHKIPWTRLEHDIDANFMSTTDLIKHFQLLTREHNLLKDRACGVCKLTNIRPALLGIFFWYQGNNLYRGTCVGCGWYDCNKWREELNKKLQL